MKKDNLKTDVIFRKYRDGQIIALFVHNKDRHANIESYMHVGQHSMADYGGVVMCTKLATKEEYQNLFEELESIGYNLQIVKKQTK